MSISFMYIYSIYDSIQTTSSIKLRLKKSTQHTLSRTLQTYMYMYSRTYVYRQHKTLTLCKSYIYIYVYYINIIPDSVSWPHPETTHCDP